MISIVDKKSFLKFNWYKYFIHFVLIIFYLKIHTNKKLVMNLKIAPYKQLNIQVVRLVIILIVLLFNSNPLFSADHQVLGEAPEPTFQFMFWALVLGGFSAISLVLGSALGLVWQPRPRMIAAFTAFGAGALLAALSVELIAPTVIEFVEQKQTLSGQSGDHDKLLEFVFLITGCVFGGLLFFFLNEALNSSGGYLRKVSTTISYFNRQRRNRYNLMLKRISKIEIFRSITPSHVDVLVRYIRHSNIKAGKYLFYEGNMAQKLFLIESGEVEILNNGKKVKTLGPGNFLGETAMLSREPVGYSAMAITNLKVFELSYNDLQHLKDSCLELQEILESEAKQEFNPVNGHISLSKDNLQLAEEWSDEAEKHLHHTSYLPTQSEINETEKNQAQPHFPSGLEFFSTAYPRVSLLVPDF
jgi:CRP-like cAMP-binding protein